MTFLVDFEIYTVLAAAKIQIIRRFKMACRNTYSRRSVMLDQMKELSPTIKELTVENGIVKDLTQNADDLSNGRI